MDSWEWNKIAGAVLGTLIFVLIVAFAANAIYEAPKPAKPSYTVPAPVPAPPPVAPPAQNPANPPGDK